MFIVQQKGEEIRAVEKDNKQEVKKKKKKEEEDLIGDANVVATCYTGGLFKSCISSIFPFSFCTG